MAIEEFKARNDELDWYDAQYDNIAQPSIVSIQDTETNGTVLEGFDFPITATDARGYASGKMLEALEFVRMTFADIEASKRKGYYARCPKIVDEAIAEADTLLLTVPNQLGVDYNAHVIEAILTHVAPAMGWR